MVLARRTAVVVAVLVPALLGLTGCTRFGATLSRPSDPVVLQGASVPKLLGGDPAHVVGFAWDGSAWHQVAVQVDERDHVNPGVIYHRPASLWPTLAGTSTPYTMLVYTPPPTLTAGYSAAPTYTPSDSNPAFDADDELSFLANDSGKRIDGSVTPPAGVDAATREEVTATDPLGANQVGYVYLFHSATLTGGSAGTTGVQYTFSLDSGDYKTTYKMGAASLSPNNTWGFNPEHSTVVTPNYRLNFGDRWLNNGMAVTAAGASGAGILERSHYYVTVGCGRSEDTFDGAASNPGEGTFILNLSGPVRAIRSYLGANSYVYTANTHFFYPQREDVVTDVRGHAGLPGYGSADDYVTGTTGLRYTDPANPGGVPIDGTPDSVVPIAYTTGSPAPAIWQEVSGPQGSVVTVRSIETDITGLDVSTVYKDTPAPTPAQCTGDAAAYGQNGANLTSPVNNVPVTDPTLTATPASLVVHRARFFRGPNLPAADAATLGNQVRSPLQVTVTG